MISKLTRDNVSDITPYQPGKPIEEVQRQLGIKKVIKLASNENPLGVSGLVLKAIKKYSRQVYRYPDGSCFYLKNKVADYLKVNTDSLLFGNGSDEIIDIIIKTFLNRGEEVLTSDITFLEYKIITQANGGLFKAVVLRDFKYDLKAIKENINDKTKIIFIANPNNPTGTYINRQEISSFLEELPPGVIVVIDEAYREFVDVDDFPESLLYLDKNLIILRTFSKAFGLAGLRVGYAIAKPDIIQYMQRVRQPFNVNYLAQIAAQAALDDKEFLKKTIAVVAQGKELLYDELKKMGLNCIPSVANFILVQLPADGLWLSQAMLNYGVIVRDMKQYGLDNYIRVTIGKPEENKRFIAVLKQLIKKI